jgi:hypothetical protein
MQSVSQRMEVLAALEPSPFPVISLYLSLSTNQNGREEYQQFVRKVFSERARALPEQSPERESFDKDVKRIQEHLEKKGRLPHASDSSKTRHCWPMSVAWAHYLGSAYEQTEQSESRDVHAARAPDPGRRRAGVAQAERGRIPAHMATGQHQDEATAGAGRRRCSRHGEACRQRDDGRDVATSSDTSGFACDEEHDGNQRGSVECQGESREGEDGQDPQIEENDRHCKDRQGHNNRYEADDD